MCNNDAVRLKGVKEEIVLVEWVQGGRERNGKELGAPPPPPYSAPIPLIT